MIWTPPALALLLLVWVELRGLDEPLFRFFNGLSAYTGPGLWANLTLLGDGLVCAVLLLPWLRRHPERVWAGLVGALFMFLVLRSFKGMLSLPRPLGVLPEGTVTVIGPGHRKGAFPSGHTATIFLYLGTWALTERRRWLSASLLLPATLVGISRMAVGVHWPSDVLGGAALGWLSAWFGLRVAEGTPWGMGKRTMNTLSALLLICALVLLFVDHTGYPGVLWLQRSIALGCLIWGGAAAATVLSKGSNSPDTGPTAH
jgi:membrane-associated phospholipid phosphatase